MCEHTSVCVSSVCYTDRVGAAPVGVQAGVGAGGLVSLCEGVCVCVFV